MTKVIRNLMLILPVILLMTGCDSIGNKSANMSIIYGIMAAFSIALLCVYCGIVAKKELWMIMLFSSVTVVNIGYFALAISRNLEEALLANRLSYIGSVFLPMSMLMIIIISCKIKYKKCIPFILCAISIFVFIIAATPGYYDIYYKEVYYKKIDGVAVLDKVYGPWHSIYLYYLILYFGAMICIIARACLKKHINNTAKVIILAGAVFINIGLWLIEQVVRINFEFLSVSYVITEFFLLSLYLMEQWDETKKSKEETKIAEDGQTNVNDDDSHDEENSEQYEAIVEKSASMSAMLCKLTPAEKRVYDLYISGDSPQKVMEKLCITNNTLKFHNKNIYAKLGVKNRKELIEAGQMIDKQTNSEKE